MGFSTLRLHPRTSRTLAAALVAFASFVVAHAQTHAGRSSSPETRDAHAGARPNARKKSDADAARAQREVQEAVAALREVEQAARSFDDLYMKVSTQAEVADALWPYDEQEARASLRRAWEAVTAPGIEEKARGGVPSEIQGEGMSDELTEERRLVIESAAKHDRRLADTFMREFEHLLSTEDEAGQADAQTGDSTPARHYERSLSVAGWQRLFIARSLVEAGEYQRGAELAAPLVSEGACPALLDFILELLPHDADDARTLYLRLLERTRADASADADDVLLLASPIVSPGLRLFVGDGGVSLKLFRAGASLPPSVRGAFFDTAAAILLRATAEGRRDALYFAVGYLLPFFERESPQYAPALHVRLASLAADIKPASRESLGGMMSVTNNSPKNQTDPLAPLLSQLSSELAATKDTNARDHARLDMVLAASRRGLWDRARTVAADVEDANARQYARLIIAVSQVLETAKAFGDDGDAFEHAADFVRAADVPPGIRASGVAQAAELASRRGKRERADALFSEALNLASQSERGGERVTALALVTLSAMRADAPLLRELLSALARAADETEDLPYGALSFNFKLDNNGRDFSFDEPSTAGFSFTAPEPPVSLPDLFAAAARLDAIRTLKQARAFKDEELRADATLAAARAALEKNSRRPAAPAAEVLRRGGK